MPELQPVYDLTQGGNLDLAAARLVTERELWHSAYGSWPSDSPTRLYGGDEARIVASHRYRGNVDYILVFDSDQAVAKVEVENGTCTTKTYAKSQDRATELKKIIEEIQPRSEPQSTMVPINFWSYGSSGPAFVRRDVEGLPATDVHGNYSEAAQAELDGLLTKTWRPGTAGQLLLWTGPPGTGKTHAIRALAYEWRDWCDMHYVTDPEKFFGSHSDYMIQVLLRDGEEGLSEDEGDDEPRDGAGKRWSLLILEDAGEFLQPDAKVETGGAALSRFLNVVDGLIGHGLKILVLVTTNEEVKQLLEAVSRPGRCAADVRFEKFSQDESAAWLSLHGGGDGSTGKKSLAELYAKVNDTDRRAKAPKKMGF